jgi:hypothetical protein
MLTASVLLLGIPETNNNTKPYLARFKNWREWPCHGRRFRQICIFGVGDLPLLRSRRRELFANKFYWDYQGATLDCVEEMVLNRTRDQYLGLNHFNPSFYSDVGFVQHMVT